MMKNWVLAAVICAIGISTSGVQAAHFALKPVTASGTHVLVGNDEIRLTGGGQKVRAELRLSGWGAEPLKGWQAQIDCSTYSNGIGGNLTPAVQPCTMTSQCTAAYEPGSFCQLNVCFAGFINRTRSDWIFFQAKQDCGATTSDVGRVSCDYLYFSVTDPACLGIDGGVDYYAGTLVLDVPANAAGTYEVAFFEDPKTTFMLDENNSLHPSPHSYSRMKIVIVCQNNANCNDNNACTTDVCSSGTCINTPNYNTSTQCCNPANGNLVTISDGNPCTSDSCNPVNGQVTHNNLPALTACGDPTNTECNKPDSCDGAGSCLPRFEPNTTTCGSPVNTTCNPADLCNGAGSCITNIAPANTPCGDPSTGACDNADSCNGLGTCLNNQVPNNTPCDDLLFCTLNERCTGGVCGGGSPRNCADLLTCTTDVCDEVNDECDHNLDPDRCLIDGVCYLDGALNPGNTCEECDSVANTVDWSVLPDGTTCNDGNACTGTGREGIGVDECTSGTCVGVPDPECNDQCEFAVPAIVGQNFSNNASTGPDDGEASCQPDSNGDVWFEYIADCDGAVFISTTGSALAPVNDPVLSVYDECPTLAGVEIACDDDSGAGLNGALVFMTTGGTRYLIRIAGFQNNVGPIVLNLVPVDDCLIDGVCYAEGDLNPANDCQACIPDLSTTQWSSRPEGASCGNIADTECDSPDACDGAGVCEVNYKPDGTSCSDEMVPNECTQDLCDAGLCVHPPEPAGLACGDPANTDCDNPDTCDGGGLCADNFEDAGFPCGDSGESQCDNPDICDDAGLCLENLKPDGTPCDDEDICTGTDICTEGLCAGGSILQAPLVEAISSKHLRITPQPPGSPAPVALYVTSPDYPCLSQYVNLSGGLVGFDDRVIQLVDDWGTIIVQDPDLVPGTTYEVRAECGAFLSAPGTDDTYPWGDVNGDGLVNVIDHGLIVDYMKNLPVPLPFESMDLAPCVPNNWINIIDVGTAINALKGFPFPCTLPCHD